MSIAIRAVSSPGEVRAAATCDGTLMDYVLWRPGAPDGVGDLHRGRVTAMVPGMAGPRTYRVSYLNINGLSTPILW